MNRQKDEPTLNAKEDEGGFANAVDQGDTPLRDPKKPKDLDPAGLGGSRQGQVGRLRAGGNQPRTGPDKPRHRSLQEKYRML